MVEYFHYNLEKVPFVISKVSDFRENQTVEPIFGPVSTWHPASVDFQVQSCSHALKPDYSDHFWRWSGRHWRTTYTAHSSASLPSYVGPGCKPGPVQDSGIWSLQTWRKCRERHPGRTGPLMFLELWMHIERCKQGLWKSTWRLFKQRDELWLTGSHVLQRYVKHWHIRRSEHVFSMKSCLMPCVSSAQLPKCLREKSFSVAVMSCFLKL